MHSPTGPERTSPFYWNEEVRPGLRVAFTSVAAGNLALHVGADPAAVRRNRQRLEEAMDVPPGSLRFMSQTHSDRVALLGGEGPQAQEAVPPDADGMLSLDGREAMAVLVADCVPIVLAGAPGPEGEPGPTAVVHAGRAGVGNGIVTRAVDLLHANGARDVTGWIGPSVCGSCYEVPEEMMLGLARSVPAASSRTAAGTPALDLPAAVRFQLDQSGVRVVAVEGAGTSCTLENPHLYSHRREPGAGRIAGLVWRT
jgi:YfiH family protein